PAGHHRADDAGGGPAGPGLPTGGRDGLRPLHRSPCSQVLQPQKGHDLRRLQRDPAQHHRQGNPGAMNFDLTEEQQLLADSLKRYLANEYSIDTRAKIVDSPTGWSEKVWAAFAEMGLLGVPFAEEHGGFGGTAVDVMLVMEALVVEPYWVNVGLGGRLIARAGSVAQQKAMLPPLIQGKHRMAFAHTERPARYDLAHVGTRAKRGGAGYTLNGEKRAVLHGGSADTLIVSARTAGSDTDA